MLCDSGDFFVTNIVHNFLQACLLWTPPPGRLYEFWNHNQCIVIYCVLALKVELSSSEVSHKEEKFGAITITYYLWSYELCYFTVCHLHFTIIYVLIYVCLYIHELKVLTELLSVCTMYITIITHKTSFDCNKY